MMFLCIETRGQLLIPKRIVTNSTEVIMNIAIILCVIEVISILVKKFKPEWAKLLPVVNTAIGVVASLILKTDVLVGLATAGISCAGYDLIHGFFKKESE